MTAPDRLRDTLAHALFSQPDVTLYGGDGIENAQRIAGEMLREYDFSGAPGGPRPSNEARKVALDAMMAGAGLDEALEVAYAIDWSGGTVAPGGPAEPETEISRLIAMLAAIPPREDTCAECRAGLPHFGPCPRCGCVVPHEMIARLTAMAESLRGSVPGGSATGEREP